jgi:Host cell surface-exposed lipoprotein
MKLVLKITAGVVLGLTVLIGGCTAVIGGMAASDPEIQKDLAALDSAAVAESTKEEHPDWTSGQANAVEAAESYLETSGFSKAGLQGQLSSKAADGYSEADATFAVNHVKVNWNAEAVEAAKDYLDTMPFSKTELIGQLSSSAADQFTPAQAQYAADRVY